jgi:hypothetical protein
MQPLPIQPAPPSDLPRRHLAELRGSLGFVAVLFAANVLGCCLGWWPRRSFSWNVTVGIPLYLGTAGAIVNAWPVVA